MPDHDAVAGSAGGWVMVGGLIVCWAGQLVHRGWKLPSTVVTPILGFEGLCAAGSLLAPGLPDLAQGGWANLEKVNGRNFRDARLNVHESGGWCYCSYGQ